MKKKKKRANAFTLVEIISVIVIIGMFLVVMVPVISNAIVTSRLKFYEGQENSVQVSGRNYFTSNRERLPKEVGSKEIVSLRSLISSGYIKNVIDDQNKECDYDLSYVEVTNVGVGEYQYYVRLVCADYDSQTAFSEWSDWQLTYPSGQNIEIESANFYNYKEAFTYTDMGSCSSWTDVVGYKEDELKKVATIIDQDIQDRTVYSYQDQRWKWYKMDQEDSACLTTSPGAEWTYSTSVGCSSEVVEYDGGSCLSSRPTTEWSQGARCNDPVGPATNPSNCRTSTPTAHPGGTWSAYSYCYTDVYCPWGWVGPVDYWCSMRYTCAINTTRYFKYHCPEGIWVIEWGDDNQGSWSCVGNCDTPCTQACGSLYVNKVEPTCVTDPAPSGSCTIGQEQLVEERCTGAYCYYDVGQYATEDEYYTYRWTATPIYKWIKTTPTAIYSKTVTAYHPNYSSTAPSGYPLKDEAQTNYTEPSAWSEAEPTNYPYRTINTKQQKRSCNILKDWSGNKLTNYVLEEDLVSHLGKSLAEITADPNLNVTSIVKYRYRQRQLKS